MDADADLCEGEATKKCLKKVGPAGQSLAPQRVQMYALYCWQRIHVCMVLRKTQRKRNRGEGMENIQ